MRAATFNSYGGPEVVQFREVPDPKVTAGQVLIRVAAAALNPVDWHEYRGEPRIMRLSSGLRRPSKSSLGSDVAGEVISVAPDVRDFAPGQQVFGQADGSVAELAVASADALAHRPTGLSAVEAAALPLAGQTAIQALEDQGGLQSGHKVLMIGASGGVGTLAVQLAAAAGAEVTGVCSGRNAQLVRDLGAHRIIDYTAESITGEFDLVIDAVGQLSLAELGALAPRGRCVLIAPGPGTWARPLLRLGAAAVRGRLGRGDFRAFFASTQAEQIARLGREAAAGRLTSVLDQQLQMDQVLDALTYLESGRARGKIVLTLWA